MQEQEKQRYEQKLQERALAKERKRLEREAASKADAVLSGYRREGGEFNDALSLSHKCFMNSTKQR